MSKAVAIKYLTVETLGMHLLRWVVVLMASLMFIASSAREAFGRDSEVPTLVDSVQHTVIQADTSVDRNTNGPTLHLFYDRGLAGYLDSTGKVHIKPTFAKADYFSEGLAPARVNGRYGYINTQGAWYIPEQFDFATPFSEGRATAYIGGHAYIIDLQGKVVHHGVYEDVGLFDNGLAVVYLNQYQRGLVNREGVLLADPKLHRFYVLDSSRILLNNRAPATEEQLNRFDQEWILIDGSGEVIKQLSGYKEAKSCYGSKIFVLSRVQDGGKTPEQVLFNLDGQYVASLTDKANQYVSSVLPSGYVVTWGTDGKQSDSRSTYSVVGPDGTLVVKLGTDCYVESFGSEYFVVRDHKADTSAVFKCGKSFQHLFTKRRADLRRIGNLQALAVKDSGAFSLLTPEGRRLPTLPTIETSDEIYYDSNFILSSIYSSDGSHRRLRFMSWSDGSEPLLVRDSVSEVVSIQQGVITFLCGGTMVVATLGSQILYEGPWRNIDGSRRDSYDHKPEIWRMGYTDSAISLSDPVVSRRLQDAEHDELWRSKSVGLVVIEDDGHSRADSLTVEVLVINSQSDTLAFDASDSRLYLVMEARRGSDDPWVEIEYLPSSWCGNSYYEVYLPPKTMWTFRAKRYQGDIPVECRMKLTGIIDEPRFVEKSSRSTVYSNTFRASVQPGQLWRIQRHRASDLMDPY
ncbi:MAG: WG repeat-containing protein [Ignavibacteriae bacterium]|nr:MAG: WG repeat-containing protein [Ignavibacteriota bacterium]